MASNLFDVFSDVGSGLYHRQPKNVTRLFLTNDTVPENCVALPNTTGEKEEYYECLEEDTVWAAITFVCIQLPGLVAAVLFTCSLLVNLLTCKASNSEIVKLLTGAVLFLFIPFPLMVFTQQIASLLTAGDDQMELWSAVFLYAEGSLEASPQSLLLLYIIFSDAERYIPGVQMASLISSLFTISKTAIELFICESYYDATSLSDVLNHTETSNDSLVKDKSLFRKLFIMAQFSPAFILGLAFKLGTIAFIWALLPYWVFIYIAVGIAITFIVAYIKYDGPRDESVGSALFYSLTNITITAKCPLGSRRKNYGQMMAVSITWMILHTLALVSLMIWVVALPESTRLDHWSSNRFTLVRPIIFFPTTSGLLLLGPFSILALWSLKKQVLTLEEKEKGEWSFETETSGQLRKRKFWEPDQPTLTK